MKVFISYSSDDKTIAQEIRNYLREAKLDPFLAEDSIAPGKDWQREMLKHLRATEVLLVLWSKSAARSHWVGEEIDSACKRKEVVVLILRLDETPPRSSSIEQDPVH